MEGESKTVVLLNKGKSVEGRFKDVMTVGGLCLERLLNVVFIK